MKKLIMILLAAAAFSCTDNRSSERNDDAYDNDNTEAVEPADSTTVESDTTSTDNMDRRQDNDNNLDRGESGTERDSL